MLTSILIALQAPLPAYGPLDLLVENWVCRSDRLASGPVWRFLEIRPDGEGLTGRFGTRVWRDGKRDVREEGSLRITGRGEAGRLVWTSRNGSAITYRLRVSGHEGVMFETSADVSPQRISFRYGMFRMEVVTSQRDGSNAASMVYYPPGLHTGVGSCDGGR